MLSPRDIRPRKPEPRRQDLFFPAAGVSPDGDGLGHSVDVVGLVLGALVHGAREGVQAAVLVHVLGLRRHLGWTRVDLVRIKDNKITKSSPAASLCPPHSNRVGASRAPHLEPQLVV